jgi:hypothetical protein
VLEDLSQIGELVGGFGALLALIYLATQVRQNNIIARAQSRQTLLDTWSAGNWDLVRDTELLRAFGASLAHWPDVPDEQKTKFDIGMSRFLTNLENGLLLHDAGLLDKEVLENISNWMVTSVLSPGGSRWWAETSIAPVAVREYIEQRLAEIDGEMGSIDEALPYWMSMAGEMPPRS